MGDFYVEHEYWVAAFQLVTAMLGMGATLTARDFRDVVREPGAVTLGMVVQLVLVQSFQLNKVETFPVVPPPISLPTLHAVTALSRSALPA